MQSVDERSDRPNVDERPGLQNVDERSDQRNVDERPDLHNVHGMSDLQNVDEGSFDEPTLFSIWRSERGTFVLL